jgi:nucleotide-binding universal stress UspA family protein
MPETIVVGTDGSESAARAVGEAARLAKALDAELHVVSAFEPLRDTHIEGAAQGAAEVWAPLPDSQVEAILSEAKSRLAKQQLKATTHALRAHPADALLEVANDVNAGLIVVGSKGMHGARRLALGNVPNKVSHRARCNVLIVSTDAD